MANEPTKRYATFDDWYTLDITLRGSPRPLCKAAWEAGLAEGRARGCRLTPAEIADLHRMTEDAGLDEVVVVTDCPQDGVDGVKTRLVAYFEEYPDEGCVPLGKEL